MPALLAVTVLLALAGCSGPPQQQQQQEDRFWTAYTDDLGAAAPTDPAALARLRTESVAFGRGVCTKVSHGMSTDDIVSQGGGSGGAGRTADDLELEITTAVRYLCPTPS